MKLQATIGDFTADVNVRIDGSRVQGEVDGRVYDLSFRRAADNRVLLMSNGRVFDCRIEGEVRSGAVEVIVGAECYSVALTDPKRLRSAAVMGAQEGGAAQIVAPMPGKIVRVLAAAGTEVEAGAGIVVVEAMKMQNEMKSPKAGRVVAVNVNEGATVNRGDVLAVIE